MTSAIAPGAVFLPYWTQDKQIMENNLRSSSVPPSITDTSEADAILTSTLRQVCEETEWEYGEVWMPTADNTILELMSARYISTRVDSEPPRLGAISVL